MKSLLDILNEERKLVDLYNSETEQIDRLAKDIKQIQGYQPDCESKTNDIQKLTDERNLIISARSVVLETINDVRADLANYVRRIIQ